MTIPVPPDLTTSEADAYRAGYRRACADLAEAAMARARLEVEAAKELHEAKIALTRAEVKAAYSNDVRAAGLVRFRMEQPGDREPTGLDGRGA